MTTIILNQEHIIQRAVKRMGLSEDKVWEHWRKLKRVFEKEIPEDWRFTTSPTAYFLISYRPGNKIDYRILGRSYRDKIKEKQGKMKTAGKEIIKKLQAPKITRSDLEAIAEEYLELLKSPKCSIFHELKTVLAKNATISQEKELQRAILGTIKHLVPLSAKRLANRPNAVVIGEEVWVRQREYMDPTIKPIKEYLLFNKLNKNGVDKSRIKIFTLDEQGNLSEVPSIKVSGAWGIPKVTQGSNLRSQSYWTLPTYIDAVYWDLLYGKEHWLEDANPQLNEEIGLDQKTAFLLCRLENLFQLVRKKTGEP